MENKGKTNYNQDYDYFYKIVLAGNSAVGKSSLLMRFADDRFTETYINTIGVDFRFKTIIVDGQRVKIQIWDTAGQEKFRTMTSTYFRNSDAVVVVYDITDPATHDEISSYWIPEINNNVDNVIFCVLGNKSDMASERKVPQTLASSLTLGTQPAIFYEVSAKTGSNVEKAFEDISRGFIKARKNKQNSIRSSNKSNLSQSQDRSLQDNNEIYDLHAHLAQSKYRDDDNFNCSC